MPNPPIYDYYNPSTWIVNAEDYPKESSATIVTSELEANRTSDAFARLQRGIDHADGKDYQDISEYDRRIYTPPRTKPVPAEPSKSSTISPIPKLPNRQPAFRIFADEEDIYANNSQHRGIAVNMSLDGEGPFAELTPPHAQDMQRSDGTNLQIIGNENSTEEQQEAARHKKAHLAAAKHREKFAAVLGEDEITDLDHSEMVEKMLRPSMIAVPDPPKLVGSVGKNGQAAVWWEYDRENIPMGELPV